MKVFISWSGDMSREIGEAFRHWLPSVLQFVKPYFTPDDIGKGTKWDGEIQSELKDSSVGIFCVTPESVNSAWMMFEAGAVSKTVEKSHVCPVLFGMDSLSVGPLANFQQTRFNETDMLRLIVTINNAGQNAKLDDKTRDGVFKKWWPDLERPVAEIIQKYAHSMPKLPARDEREILEEILVLTRQLVAERDISRKQVKEAMRRALRRSPLPTKRERELAEAIATAESHDPSISPSVAELITRIGGERSRYSVALETLNRLVDQPLPTEASPDQF